MRHWWFKVKATWKRLPRWGRIAVRSITLILGITILWVFIYGFVIIPSTPLMFLREAEMQKKGKTPRTRYYWVPLREISNNLQLAAVCAEDQQFTAHHGFDFEAMWEAFQHNSKHKRVRGGSTITQQTAKNVFLWPGRSYIRKICESWFTLWMEILWSKERIMEVYLNVIEMGDGIYGAEAASLKYFYKHAAKLNAEEAAILVSTFPNPRRWNAARPTAYIQKNAIWTQRQMQRWGGKLDYDQLPPRAEEDE